MTSAYYQINLFKQPLWRFISLIYGWCVERVAYDKLDQWIADLDDLLEWQDADSEAAEDLESDSFLNMMAKGGGG